MPQFMLQANFFTKSSFFFFLIVILTTYLGMFLSSLNNCSSQILSWYFFKQRPCYYTGDNFRFRRKKRIKIDQQMQGQVLTKTQHLLEGNC